MEKSTNWNRNCEEFGRDAKRRNYRFVEEHWEKIYMKETNSDLTKISKYISLILRHKPEVIGMQLDAHGWADVQM